MHLPTTLTFASVLLTAIAGPEQGRDAVTQREETCAPLWDIALSVRQEFITKRAQVNPLGLEAYDRFFGYYESGMYNMLEACGSLQNFRYPPRSEKRGE